jgi:hypothetical protein
MCTFHALYALSIHVTACIRHTWIWLTYAALTRGSHQSVKVYVRDAQYQGRVLLDN